MLLKERQKNGNPKTTTTTKINATIPFILLSFFTVVFSRGTFFFFFPSYCNSKKSIYSYTVLIINYKEIKQSRTKENCVLTK